MFGKRILCRFDRNKRSFNKERYGVYEISDKTRNSKVCC